MVFTFAAPVQVLGYENHLVRKKKSKKPFKKEECLLEKTTQHVFFTYFSHFENLYFDHESLTFFSVGKDVEIARSINTSDYRGYFWKQYGDCAQRMYKPSSISGTTILVLEKKYTTGHSAHFFHFLEHLLGIWNFGGEESRYNVELVVLASNGNGVLKNWKGANDVTYHLIKALFPHAEIKSWPDFVAYTKDKVVCFEKVIVSDRAMDVFKKEPYYTEKMIGGYFQALEQDSLERLASHVWDYCDVIEAPSDKMVVTYVKRVGTRCLNTLCEKELISKIRELAGIELRIVDFARIPFREQIQCVSSTDVLLGVHGNGLSHVLFLPTGGTLIELFPKDSFRSSYRMITQSRGLNYFGWIDPSGWISDKEAETLGCFGDVAVKEVNTNVDAVIAMLEWMRVH